MMASSSATTNGSLMRCDFCGHEFDAGCATQSCKSCPMVSNCGQLACPNCGYPILRESALLRWLRGVKLRAAKSAPDVEVP